MKFIGTLTRAQSALVELGVLFLPGIPALVWLWPSVAGTPWNTPAQAAVYIYLIAGAFFIGRRRWTWDQLGLNGKGLLFTGICGSALIVGRLIVLAATSLPLSYQFATVDRLLEEIFYYLVLVGLCEELVFRGVMFRALDEWRGTRLAIWGSAVGFALFHLGHGDWTIAVGLVLGAVFAAIRWRTGGIVGLIIVHALYDLSVVAIMPDLSLDYMIKQVQVNNWFLVVLGYAMMIAVGIYLWKAPMPAIQRRAS